MSLNVRKNSGAASPKPLTPLRVRVPENTHKKLAAAAKAAGRTLHSEMVRALERSVGEGIAQESTLYASGLNEARYCEAMGQISGVLLSRLIGLAGDKSVALAILKTAEGALRAELGASETVPPEYDALAQNFGRQLLREIRSAMAASASARDLLPATFALAGVGEALGLPREGWDIAGMFGKHSAEQSAKPKNNNKR